MENVLNQLLNGLGVGLTYFLIAVGLTVILGVQNFVNFSHGAFFMLGAYASYTCAVYLDNFWLALAIGPLVVGIIGFVIERFLLRRMYQLAHAYQIIATFGIALVIQELVTMIWGPDPHNVQVPRELSGVMSIFGLRYPYYGLFVILLTAILAAVLWLVLERTRLGAILRAGSESVTMVSSLGINIYRIFTVTFVLGVALAGIGGVLNAPLRSISPATGDEVIGIAFVVVVIGGMGSFGGALLGAILIGLVQAMTLLVWPTASAASAFIFMAIVLILRPDGLLGRVNAPPV